MGDKQRSYKLGVALSGGGARGFAHLGFLYAMEEFGLRPDIIAGVSAGSLVAALYASGVSPIDILKPFYQHKFSTFAKLAVPTDGIFRMDGFKAFIAENSKVERIEDAVIPLVICATDIENCRPVQWREGNLVERVAASCSLPIVFKPAEIDGVDYVDGGVLHNLPAWAIREECDYLIGVNVSPALPTADYTGSLLDIALRSYHMMSRHNAQFDIDLCDLVVSVDTIADTKVFDLNGKERTFKEGYKAAKAALSKWPLLETLKTNKD